MAGPYASQVLVIPYTMLTKHQPSVSFELDIDDDVTAWGVEVYRDVPNGLNYQDSTVGLELKLDVSDNGGSTWSFNCAGTTDGGVISSSGREISLATNLGAGPTIPLTSPTPLLRATLTASGLAASYPLGLIGLVAASHDSTFNFLPHD